MCSDKVTDRQLGECSTSLVPIFAVTVTTNLASAAMIVSSTFAILSSSFLHAAKYLKVSFYIWELLRLCHTIEICLKMKLQGIGCAAVLTKSPGLCPSQDIFNSGKHLMLMGIKKLKSGEFV